MSQLFAAVYEVTSATIGQPSLRLNLVVNRESASVVGTATWVRSPAKSMKCRCAASTWKSTARNRWMPSCWPARRRFFPLDEEPASFQMLMVLPSAWKEGQACYKMTLGKLYPRVIDMRDGKVRAVLPEAVY
jgi:hypothetical protein